MTSVVQPRALFLDRDGVINIDCGYLYRPDQVVFAAAHTAGVGCTLLYGDPMDASDCIKPTARVSCLSQVHTYLL